MNRLPTHKTFATATPDFAKPEILSYVDEAGREFNYVHIHRPGATGLGVHFSAFFGGFGGPSAKDFKGYFHRMKMLGSCTDYSWLFFCDAFGAFENGTYYTGEAGDLYVERAMRELVQRHMSEYDYAPDRVVTMGSSMGATAALKFGLEFDVAGIVAIAPHIDLDTSAALQDRRKEVNWICPDGDALAYQNRALTRQVTNAVLNRPADRPLPRLFIQSARDDAGVHDEQVLPLLDRWVGAGGRVDIDERPIGGHTSAFATRAVLLDVVRSHLADESIDVERYRTDAEFKGELPSLPLTIRLRRRLGSIRREVISYLINHRSRAAVRADAWRHLQAGPQGPFEG